MRIYLDVDDTLADFREHAVALGVPRWEGSWYTTDPATWTDEQRFIQAETNRLMSTREFWLTMPVAEGALQLADAAHHKTGGDVYLLTALPSFAKDDDLRKMIFDAKMEYATKTLDFAPSRVIICPRADKIKHATRLSQCREWSIPNVLIDDAVQNCQEWRDAFGIAIHHEVGNMNRTIDLVWEL